MLVKKDYTLILRPKKGGVGDISDSGYGEKRYTGSGCLEMVDVSCIFQTRK